VNILKVCMVPILIVSLGACSAGKSQTQSLIVEIKGDPNAFIHGTTGDVTSGFPKSLFTSEGVAGSPQYSMVAGGFYDAPRIDINEAVASQQPTIEAESQDVVDRIKTGFSLVPHPERPEHFFLVAEAGKERQKLLFVERDERLFFVELQDHRGVRFRNAKVEHYSVKDTEDAFSLLISGSEEFGRYLFSLTFSRIQPEASILERTVTEAYNYLFGQGVEIAQDPKKTAKMEICGNKRPTLNRWTEKGITAWSPELVDRLEITTEVVENCPPYSDLNRSTVHFVEGWIEVTGASGTLGMTLTLPNYFKNDIIDSDIFFLMDEWEEGIVLSGFPDFEMTEEQIAIHGAHFQEKFIETTTHEMGHYLGLGHTGKGFGTETPSIMSYDRSTTGLQPYDTKAVQELYPILSDGFEDEEASLEGEDLPKETNSPEDVSNDEAPAEDESDEFVY